MIDSNKINSGLWSYDLQKSKHFKVISPKIWNNLQNSVEKSLQDASPSPLKKNAAAFNLKRARV